MGSRHARPTMSNKLHREVLFKLLVVVSTCALNASRAQSSLTHKHASMTTPKRVWCNRSAARVSIDTEAGVLSGISRKRSIRSNPYWFTEFCNSQCLSHFAAPFIVVRTETSIAESCELHMAIAINRRLHQMTCSLQWQWDRTGMFFIPSNPPPASICMENPNVHPHTDLTEEFTRVLLEHVRMILPQVHLRKPCYDFSFL